MKKNNANGDVVTLIKTNVVQARTNKIHFEPRMEMRPDLAFVETFQDGSQLIRKRGLMIIVDASVACLTHFQLRADLTLFSGN